MGRPSLPVNQQAGEGKEGVGPRTLASARMEGDKGQQVGQGGDATVVWI